MSGDLRYPLSRKLSVVGTVGYDEIDTNDSPFFEDDDLSGVFWKAGLLATPAAAPKHSWKSASGMVVS